VAKKYWLFKADPQDFSIDDLANEPGQTTCWDGVRNYMARNLLRDDIKKGDEVLFYHSNSSPKGVVGICRVVKSGYPDNTARISKSRYFDPKATEDNPIWYMVDVKLVRKLPKVIELSELKETRGLEKMMVTQRGSRLSVQPVTPSEWDIIMKFAGG
jgi:predicted RNA-binding protein with PUA-like domain